MSDLPDDVAATLLRGIGSFIRELPAQELPAHLRRYRSFRPHALKAHRSTLLAALDDDALRARIGHWLENDKPPLAKGDAQLLSIAVAREDGWEEQLQGSAKPRPQRTTSPPSDESKVAAERDKTRRAKEEAKKLRDELRVVQQQSRERAAELEARIADLEKRASAAEKLATEARKEAESALDRADRATRKSKATVEKLQRERDDARQDAKELRKELTKLRAQLEKPVPASAPREKKDRQQPKVRKQLRVPKGRLEDDPATLRKWLDRDDVRLVIDGYNVAKADGGYEDLQLESQRERLVEAVFTVAKMTDTETIVVFDAQRVPGRRARKTRRPVVVEWSNPGQIADDYIVGRLEELPQDPVVLVTNDKELQERGRALAATIATSQQLLALLR